MKKGSGTVSSMSSINSEFYEKYIIQTMSNLIKSETESYLNEFLQQKVLPITPVDTVRVNKFYGTREELSANAKVVVIDSVKSDDIVVKYRAYVHFGSDPVSKDYAIIQHEVGYFSHQMPSRDKFLQIPFQETIVNEGELLNKLADKINSVF